MVDVAKIKESAAWKIMEEVYDPEVPVLTVLDLGVVRDIEVNNDTVTVTITPTYTGCPAMDMIAINIKMALLQHGFTNVKIKQQLSPAWTTEWMTQAGKQKLKAYGIAPPKLMRAVATLKNFEEETVSCPRCNSVHTVLISRYGSTACKALYSCSDCKEPFDYFKCH